MRRTLLLVVLGLSLLPASAPASSAFESNWFRSPTGNIRCRYFPQDAVLACKTLNNGRAAVVPLRGRAYVLRQLTDYTFPRGPVLAYGDYWAVPRRFRCDSTTAGMRCRSLQSGRGFVLSRSGARTF